MEDFGGYAILINTRSNHAASLYSPNIAHVFYLTDFIESWEQGIKKACSACEKDGVPQLAERLSVGWKTVAVRLRMLKETGLIECIGSNFKGYISLFCAGKERTYPL